MLRSALYQRALISTGLPIRGMTTRSPTSAHPVRHPGDVEPPIAAACGRVVIPIVHQRLDGERDRAGRAQHLPPDVRRVRAGLHPDALFHQRVGGGVAPHGRGAVEAEAVDETVAVGRDDTARPAADEQRPLGAGVVERVVRAGGHEGSAERRAEGRDEQPVVSPHQRAGDGA
jgi:hypothetical protein